MSVAAGSLIVGAGVGLVGVASAQSVPTTTVATTTQSPTSGTKNHIGQGVRGTVASINGTTITVTGKNGTSYTADVSGATFLKSTTSGTKPTTVTISGIAVGDTVAVRGTVTGDSVVATQVTDGVMNHAGFNGQGGKGRSPGVMGTVTAVSGNTVTITNSNGTTYTINAGNSTVSEVVSLPISSIKVGDTLGVQGTVSGTSVTATHIMDGVQFKSQAPPVSTQ